jgi:hypothetical protein
LEVFAFNHCNKLVISVDFDSVDIQVSVIFSALVIGIVVETNTELFGSCGEGQIDIMRASVAVGASGDVNA